MMVFRQISAKLAFGLLTAIVLDTALQLVWKLAVSDIPDDLSLQSLMAIVTSPLFIVLVVMMLCQLLNWIQVLGHADLSFAQPITSLSNVSVLLLSAIYLGERIGTLQVAGVAFILLGVWCISQTDHSSSGAR
jgi:drug/metabolite transporter (DMT)-like permease